jgi:predicted transcriptional regulator
MPNTPAAFRKNAGYKHPELSDRQFEIMSFIQCFQSTHNYSPSYREIATEVGLTVAPVAHQIKQLIRKGYLLQGGRRSLFIMIPVRKDRKGYAV